MPGSDVEWIDECIHNYAHPSVKVEDSANAAILFKNGCLYNLYACNIYGANSPISLEHIRKKGRCGLNQDTGFYELDGIYAEIKDEYKPCNTGPDYWGSSHYIQIQDFYHFVRTGSPVNVNASEGQKTLEIVKGIYLSSYKKRHDSHESHRPLL